MPRYYVGGGRIHAFTVYRIADIHLNLTLVVGGTNMTGQSPFTDLGMDLHPSRRKALGSTLLQPSTELETPDQLSSANWFLFYESGASGNQHEMMVSPKWLV